MAYWWCNKLIVVRKQTIALYVNRNTYRCICKEIIILGVCIIDVYKGLVSSK